MLDALRSPGTTNSPIETLNHLKPQINPQIYAALRQKGALNTEWIESTINKLERQLNSPYYRYWNLSGEIEARDTMFRAELDSEDRLYEKPYSSHVGDIEVVFDEMPQTKKLLAHDKSANPKGAFIRSVTRNRAAIIFTSSSDRSTLVHESAHYFLDTLIRAYHQHDCPPALKTEFEKICKALGNESGATLNGEQEEVFAEIFEELLQSGVVDTQRVEHVLSNLAIKYDVDLSATERL